MWMFAFQKKFLSLSTFSSVIFFLLFLAISSKQLRGRKHPVILIILQVGKVLLDGEIIDL